MILLVALSSATLRAIAPQEAGPPPRPALERRICRQVEVTGTRMPMGRVCKTAAQWALDKQIAERILTDRQNLYIEEQERRLPSAAQ